MSENELHKNPKTSNEVSLYDYLEVIKRHIWWGVFAGLLCFATSIFYIFFWTKPVYRATALIEIEAAYSVLSPVGSLTVPKVETHIQLIKDQAVLFKALQELGIVTETISPAERERRIKDFAKPLILSQKEKTALIEINYEHPDPAQAARIVNTIGKVYQEKLLEDKEQKTDCRGVFIKQQLNEVTRQLNALEQKLQEMKVRGQGPEKTEALARQLAQIELSYMTESTRLGIKHPTVVGLEEEMGGLKKQMEQLSPSDLIYLETLREKTLNENLYNLLNTSLKQIQIELADKTVPARVVSWALIPGQPFKPDKKMNLIAGALISLIIGLVIIFLRQALDLSLDTPERLEEYLKVPVLVTVPRFKRWSQPKTSPPTITYSRDEQDLMERLRQLEIKVSPPGLLGGTILAVVSPAKASGKTTMLAYYGRAAAEDGKKVLLIDADLRAPRLHKIFTLSRDPGLTDILRDGLPLTKVIQNIPLSYAVPHPDVTSGDGQQRAGVASTLNIIPAGQTTNAPLRLLSAPRFDNLLATIRQSYDLILIDSAPIFSAAETSVLCQKTDGYLLVHKPSRLDRYLLGRFKSQFMTGLKDKCWGIVLNHARYQSADYYSYYRYYKEAEHQKGKTP